MTFASHQAELLSPAQWPLVEALFKQVFGHALPRELTQWKYAPGRGLSIGVLADHSSPTPRLAAHCGLMLRDLSAFGEPVRAAQLTDLMVAPQDRGRLLRMGSPFAKVVGHALAQLGSATNPGNPDRLTFGFPSARAMRLAERLGLVREIDQVHEVCWTPAPGPLPQAVETADRAIAGIVDHLWSLMRQDLADALIGVRDANYFLGRYLHHPTRKYQLHLVRSSQGSPLAVFALRRDENRVELSDWVAPLATIPDMLSAARAVSWAESGTTLTSWITQGFVERLAVDAASHGPTEFRIICRGDLPAALWQRHHHRWWLTPGDTDYR